MWDARCVYWPSDNPNPALRVAIAVAAPLVRLGRALGIVPNFERAASVEREIMRASGILDASASPAEEARAFARLGEEGGWYGRNGYLIRGLYHVQLVQWLNVSSGRNAPYVPTPGRPMSPSVAAGAPDGLEFVEKIVSSILPCLRAVRCLPVS